MSEHPISRFDVPDLDDLAERIGNASLRLDVLEARLDQLDRHVADS